MHNRHGSARSAGRHAGARPCRAPLSITRCPFLSKLGGAAGTLRSNENNDNDNDNKIENRYDNNNDNTNNNDDSNSSTSSRADAMDDCAKTRATTEQRT